MSRTSGPGPRSLLRQAAHRAKVARASLSADAPQTFPPGHFYSPIADVSDVRARHEQIFDRSIRDLPGIDSNDVGQVALAAEFRDYVKEMPFTDTTTAGQRYGFDNPFFSYGDGLALYSMLRHVRPCRVVEIGSGWSSALMLDVNDAFLGGETSFTFIEPYPERLKSLLRDSDRERTQILETGVQLVDEAVFAALEPGDLLFIDSTHVSRVGSDVNHIYFNVIPRLPAGVTVHIHDVFWPFEYPEDWVYDGRGWNEDYLLRALLVNNPKLQITWFNSYMAEHHADALDAIDERWMRNPGGSIYLTTA